MQPKPSHTRHNQRIGRQGEAIAVRYLRSKGYIVLGRNVRIGRRDEIDIVAFDPADHVMVFCEVKARSKHSLDYDPSLNITYRKKQSMKRAARLWIAEHTWDGGYRVDVVCVAGQFPIRHIVEIN